MASLLVTCPESAHLEMIDYEDDPLGVLIRGCTASGEGPLECPRTCAARLDRRRCSNVRVGTVLVVKSCLGRA